jgi:putative tricarboxylic transport membrane protein
MATDVHLLGVIAFGVVLGIVFGVLPGFSSTMALAVLLPLTFWMHPVSSVSFLMAVYVSSVYAGSVPAVLLNIPGTPSAIVTQLDGYPMARRGRAGEALMYGIAGSAFGGLFGWAILVVMAPLVVKVALTFRSPEYTAVAVFALCLLAYAVPGSTSKGIFAGAVGVSLSFVGMDPLTNAERLTFGVYGLRAGIDIIALVVGIFGLTEAMLAVERAFAARAGREETVPMLSRLMPPWREMRATLPGAVRGGLIGVVIGAIPAAGSAVAVTVAYAQEKRMGRNRHALGTGVPEGVVVPESANNASVGGALIPMVTLGIPGDPMTAVLIGGLLIHGLRPGPQLWQEQPEFVAALFAALLMAILLTALVGVVAIRMFARMVLIPSQFMLPAIAILCVLGAYAARSSLFDVGTMVAFGIGGYVLVKAGVPLAPIPFGLILGPIFEENLRRSLMTSGGDWAIFVTRPIALALFLIAVAVLAHSAVDQWRSVRRRRKSRTAEA